ncbi:MAG: hypothetical protein BMS9Abin17_0549 [Acidimicrobiia bacterium]|nr:MAG: hypothetical protein BMS9Abin17_0549 [Acidimicrobiia bacterium]
MADDKTSGSGGFDDWLDEDAGPATDPYASLAHDDPEEEIADWVAFSEGQASPEGEVVGDDLAPDESDPDIGESDAQEEDELDTGELEVTPPLDEGDDETSEIDVADVGDLEDDDNVDDADTAGFRDEEITEEVAAPFTVVEFAQDESEDDAEDTGELDVIPIAPYGGFDEDAASGSTADIWDHDTEASTGDVPVVAEPDSSEQTELSEEGYLANATREHNDLAEAIAIAEEQDTAQVAVASAIPGLAESVVGFEDVVEAEGLGTARAKKSGDLIARVITGIALVLAFAASLVWQPAFVAFATAIFVVGAGEFYTSLVRSDRKPIALFGFIGIIGASLGAFAWGALAIPVAFFVAVTLLLLFYAVVPGKADPMGNLSLTITVMVWVGLGTFAMLIADSDSYRPLVIAVVVTVAAMDIAQYFVGRAIGRTPLAPWVSPKKTVEGLVAGIVVALGVGAALHFVEPFELTSGLVLGFVVAVLAPLGDLAMSAAKRSLGLKDMGSVLPGHGGFLDRIDGLLFVVPAAWLAFLWAGIL